MEAHFALQKDAFERFLKFETNLGKLAIEKRVASQYESRLNVLYAGWKEFKATHTHIIQNATDDDRKSEYFVDDMYDKMEEKFFDLEVKVKGLLAAVNGPAATSVTANSTFVDAGGVQHIFHQAPPVVHALRLPQIVIPSFSGNYNDWSGFYDQFRDLIHNNATLTDVQKLHYLKSYLTGDACQLLKHLPVTADNYKICFDALVKRYENKRLLVNTQLKTLISQAVIVIESAFAIKRLLGTTTECLNALKNLGVNTDYWDSIVIYLTVQKLPTEVHHAWEVSRGSSTELPTFVQLTDFLTTRYHASEAVCVNKVKSVSRDTRPYVNPFSRESKTFHVSRVDSCSYCEGAHSVSKCNRFSKFDITKRMDAVREKHMCFNCLSTNHSSASCTVAAMCNQCSRRHHSLIHGGFDLATKGQRVHVGQREKTTTETDGGNLGNGSSGGGIVNGEGSGGGSGGSDEQANSSANNKRCLVNTSSNREVSVASQVLLATVMVAVRAENGTRLFLRALLDQGSQISFITSEAASDLGLKGRAITANIQGIGSSGVGTSRSSVCLSISPHFGGLEGVNIDAMVIRKITDFLPNQQISERFQQFESLTLADPYYAEPGKIDMLLGAEVYANIIRDGVKLGSGSCPTAQRTSFGWILSGCVRKNVTGPTVISLHHRVDVDDRLRMFWEIEDLAADTRRQLTAEEEWCEEFFRSTHKRNFDGRYVVRLPLKAKGDGSLELGRSRYKAVAQLMQIERKFDREPDVRNQYVRCMQEYIDLDHMEIAAFTDVKSCNYLPHHAVIKASSSTTKLRVVFDASRKTSCGNSLNEQMVVGPTLQQDMTAILMRWRKHPVAFAADIEKMYRQIWVAADDRDWQRIVWRTDVKKPILDFRMKTVTFGTASAPYLAIRTLQQLARDERKRWPLASAVTLEDFYVDDVMSGAWSVDEALKLQSQLIQQMKAGGFELRKWTSNREQLLENVPAGHREIQLPLSIDIDDGVKTLGIVWHPASDTFNFKIKLDPWKDNPTKRSLLSDVSRFYDPLGWISPSIIVAKIMFQRLWKAKLDWDDSLPSDVERSWRKYREELLELEKIKIHRWLQISSEGQQCEIHGFSDASMSAYGAVVYLKTVLNGRTTVNIITAKTRVAPIKVISLPRLELCAAVLLVRLMTKMHEAMKIPNVTLHAWTDSMVVLAWINGAADRWQTFVANRVSEIQSTLDAKHWRHVPTNDNPADCASRGVNPAELLTQPLWWSGPSWLVKSMDGWPEQRVPECIDEEKRRNVVLLTVTPNDEFYDQVNKVSSFNKLLRVTAYCKRFVFNSKKKSKVERKDGRLSAAELKSVQTLWFALVQQKEFEEDFRQLSERKTVRKGSKLAALNPFIDDDGVIRVGGRLQHSILPYNEKHPIILPHNSNMTTCIIRDAHRVTLHGGAQLVAAYLRRRFWILNARNTIKWEIRKCVICCRYSATVAKQMMGNLPAPRVRVTRPFTHTGVDYAGPIDVRTSRGRGQKSHKAYISIFVCLSTKAIHIELVSELTSVAFLAALRRFIARRGKPAAMYSDNGTNFVGADAVLRKIIERRAKLEESISDELAAQAIEWHFIPPSAPHFGGLWEASVKSMKTHLRRVIGDSKLTYEEMLTVLTQIEAALNSRPLCPMSTEPDDESTLTPGHFLIGDSLLAPPEENVCDISLNRLNRWQLVQRMVQQFWARWRSEYLSRLQQRPKWLQTKNNINPGDLVLIKDDQSAPFAWPMARVLSTHPGTDNLVRVVSLKTKNGITKRPISKVVPLPVQQY